MGQLRVRQFTSPQDYQAIWNRMRAFTESRDSRTPDELWLLQHTPVFTFGQAGKPEHLLDAGNIPVVHSDRGGQITYHGPGQLVAYTLVDLKRQPSGVRHMVSVLEHSVIEVLQAFGTHSYSKKSAPGVYVIHKQQEHKIASVGLRVRRGCCYHGVALNVDMDLGPFSRIHPCGYAGLPVTRLADILPEKPDWQGVEQHLSQRLQTHLS